MKSFARLSLALLCCAALAACTAEEPDLPDPHNDTRPPDERLVERLAIAYGALRDVTAARRLDAAHRYARVAVDAIAGPRGRHGAAYARPGGILPEDAPSITGEPGLALRAHDESPATSPIRAAVESTILGNLTAWRTPADRYNAIDQAVAQYDPKQNTLPALNGEIEQALAWALLALQTNTLDDIRARATTGAEHTRIALDAVRKARAARQ